MVVLCCGDRYWSDRDVILRELSQFPRGTVVVHGGARGADTIAGEVARSLGFAVRAYPVSREDWARYGLKAGPMRNRAMLDQESPELVLAFHSNIEQSRGTRNMLRQARERSVPTVLVAE